MRNLKLTILIIAVLIALVGLISIYSSTYQKEGEFWELVYKRQILWLILGIVLFFFFSNFDYRRLWDVTYFLYGFCLLLLFLVLALGIVRLGAQRWLKFIWFSIQPSEIVKLAMVIFLARYFSTKSAGDLSLQVDRAGPLRSLILPLLFTALPMGMIIEQPDLGSGIMLLVIFMIMLYLAGVRLKYILIFLLVIIACLPVLWHLLRDYQKDRLLVFLNPNIDPLGAGYTVIQSKIAVGSGGLFGKGWLSGTQSQLRFLPESHTDFIFATFAEEWGFLGCAALLLLYYLLISKGISIARRSADNFGRLLASGISAMLGIQVFINIAMNLGLAPVVGLPLPLMSYGGSSMFLTFISLGILANIDKRRGAF